MSRSSDSDSDNEDAADRFIPKSTRGWQGGDLELEHQRESLLSNTDKRKVSAAVDISQFQNHEIGKGYQAKHVVRQRTATKNSNSNSQSGDTNNTNATDTNYKNQPTAKVTDMTKKTDDKQPPSKRDKKRKETDAASSSERIQAVLPDNPRRRLKKYLASPGFVAFRKEMEDILNS